ncbi:cation transporter, partial [Fulvivirga sp. RKSG066]|uniref:cation diffusion facilitator family transporter n=1 Tax=Fulvivirga aurantia TaxID=2529383 RepID=UPI0012BC5C5A
VFTLIEIVGGLLTNSIAILSDALHDLGDSLSLGLSWYFQNISRKGRTKKYSYGYGRFSLLGAVINAGVLLGGSAIIIYEAIPRLINPQIPNTEGMIYLAIAGVVFNGAAVLKLKKGTSINEKVVMLHLIEDVLGWVAVLIGAIVMHFYDAPIIDPLLSIGIATYILFNVYKNLKESMRIILQGTPKDIKINQIIHVLESIRDVDEVHDCHMWSLDGKKNILSAHLVVKKELTIEQLTTIKNKAKSILQENGIGHATIEFETNEEDCLLENC